MRAHRPGDAWRRGLTAANHNNVARRQPEAAVSLDRHAQQRPGRARDHTGRHRQLAAAEQRHPDGSGRAQRARTGRTGVGIPKRQPSAVTLEQGRERKAERWGARTLDLDILLFGSRLLAEERLTVPHYHMHARAFVLYPLAEIAPADLQLPDGRRLPELLAACPYAGLERLVTP